MLISARIRALRKQANLTAKQLAKKAQMSQSYLTEIENGNKIINLPRIEAICNALNITINDFFNDTENESEIAQNYDLQEIHKGLKKLDNLELKLVKQYVEKLLETKNITLCLVIAMYSLLWINYFNNFFAVKGYLL